jgi:hypothetical protein
MAVACRVIKFPRGGARLGISIAAALVLGGCGARSDRLEISGKVTLDGRPLDRGSIRFTSLGEQQAMATGAMIQNGAYFIPQEKGLLPGEYHLEIHAPDPDAPPIRVSATPGGPSIPVQPDRIPPDYNVESNKKITVTADGSNEFDFDIVGKSSR